MKFKKPKVYGRTMHVWRYRGAKCPKCGKLVNSQTSLDSEPEPPHAPVPGNVSICWYCRNIGIFTKDSVRLVTEEELSEIKKDPFVKLLIDKLT